jgi:hypothetical protein
MEIGCKQYWFTGLTWLWYLYCVPCSVRLSYGACRGIHDKSAILYKGLMSLTCCSLISVPCWWKSACERFPSISFGCLCGMILIVLMFPLQFQSHVCYLVCAVHKQMLDYWFVCVVHVPCALRLWILWIVRCMLCYRYYNLICIFHWGYFGSVSQLIAGMLCLLLVGLFLDCGLFKEVGHFSY